MRAAKASASVRAGAQVMVPRMETTLPKSQCATDARPAPEPRPKPDWPLICDILGLRADRPDLLRHWAWRISHDDG